MVLKVYVDLISEPCHSLVIFLKHSDIPYEVVPVDLINRETRKPEFKNLFPLGTVPGIQDGDFTLAESVAIFRYLTAKYADMVPDFLYPKELEKRARVDEYLSWHHTGTQAALYAVLTNEVKVPFRNLPCPPEDEVKRDLENMNTALDKIEHVFLKDNMFLTGDEANISDVMAVSEMMVQIATGRDVTEGRPKLKAFVERVKERFNPAFTEVHAPIFEWGENWQKR